MYFNFNNLVTIGKTDLKEELITTVMQYIEKIKKVIDDNNYPKYDISDKFEHNMFKGFSEYSISEEDENMFLNMIKIDPTVIKYLSDMIKLSITSDTFKYEFIDAYANYNGIDFKHLDTIEYICSQLDISKEELAKWYKINIEELIEPPKKPCKTKTSKKKVSKYTAKQYFCKVELDVADEGDIVHTFIVKGSEMDDFMESEISYGFGNIEGGNDRVKNVVSYQKISDKELAVLEKFGVAHLSSGYLCNID